MYLTLKKLYCMDTSEYREEPYIKITDPDSDLAHKWGPAHMESGDTETIEMDPLEIPSPHFTVTLYESDTIPRSSEGRGDDLIGSFDVDRHATRGRYHQFLTKYELRGAHGNYSDYRLYYDITTDEDDVLPSAPYGLWLKRLYCHDAKEWPEDEVYLQVDGERAMDTHSMETGDTAILSGIIPIDRTAEIELFEQDPGTDDLLDTFELEITDDYTLSPDDEHERTFSWRRSRTRDARYTLYYAVTAME